MATSNRPDPVSRSNSRSSVPSRSNSRSSLPSRRNSASSDRGTTLPEQTAEQTKINQRRRSRSQNVFRQGSEQRLQMHGFDLASLGFTKEELDRFREKFDLFDRDGSGSVTVDELVDVFSQLGQDVTQEEVAVMVRDGDLDNNGCIEYDEFLQMMASREPPLTETDYLEAFRVFDRDGDMRIKLPELKRVAEILVGDDHLSDEDALLMFEQADVDGKGFVTYLDLIKLLEWVPSNDPLEKLGV